MQFKRKHGNGRPKKYGRTIIVQINVGLPFKFVRCRLATCLDRNLVFKKVCTF